MSNLADLAKHSIQKINKDIAKGITKSLQQEIHQVYDLVKESPLILFKDAEACNLAKVLLYVLVYELSEDEEELITAAHLSYFYFRSANAHAQTNEQLLEANKYAVILLSEYADYFRHSVAQCFRGKNQKPTQEEFVKSLQTADMQLPRLELLLLEELNEKIDDYNNDEFLIERETVLFTEQELAAEDAEIARKLDEVLLGYIVKKIQLGELRF